MPAIFNETINLNEFAGEMTLTLEDLAARVAVLEASGGGGTPVQLPVKASDEALTPDGSTPASKLIGEQDILLTNKLIKPGSLFTISTNPTQAGNDEQGRDFFCHIVGVLYNMLGYKEAIHTAFRQVVCLNWSYRMPTTGRRNLVPGWGSDPRGYGAVTLQLQRSGALGEVIIYAVSSEFDEEYVAAIIPNVDGTYDITSDWERTTITFGDEAGTACEGNDWRLTDPLKRWQQWSSLDSVLDVSSWDFVTWLNDYVPVPEEYSEGGLIRRFCFEFSNGASQPAIPVNWPQSWPMPAGARGTAYVVAEAFPRSNTVDLPRCYITLAIALNNNQSYAKDYARQGFSWNEGASSWQPISNDWDVYPQSAPAPAPAGVAGTVPPLYVNSDNMACIRLKPPLATDGLYAALNWDPDVFSLGYNNRLTLASKYSANLESATFTYRPISGEPDIAITTDFTYTVTPTGFYGFGIYGLRLNIDMTQAALAPTYNFIINMTNTGGQLDSRIESVLGVSAQCTDVNARQLFPALPNTATSYTTGAKMQYELIHGATPGDPTLPAGGNLIVRVGAPSNQAKYKEIILIAFFLVAM